MKPDLPENKRMISSNGQFRPGNREPAWTLDPKNGNGSRPFKVRRTAWPFAVPHNRLSKRDFPRFGSGEIIILGEGMHIIPKAILILLIGAAPLLPGSFGQEPEAKLKTAIFVYGSFLLRPVGFLGKRFQADSDYEIVGQDRIGGMPVVIVNAAPRPGALETINLFGKARITLTSEFAVEKNSLRFPGRPVIEEACLDDRGRSFIRSITAVTYKDLKFFTVEVDVR